MHLKYHSQYENITFLRWNNNPPFDFKNDIGVTFNLNFLWDTLISCWFNPQIHFENNSLDEVENCFLKEGVSSVSERGGKKGHSHFTWYHDVFVHVPITIWPILFDKSLHFDLHYIRNEDIKHRNTFQQLNWLVWVSWFITGE